LPLPLPLLLLLPLPLQLLIYLYIRCVISTEATDGGIVCRAVERPPHFAFAVAFPTVIPKSLP
jgi:hypothetical protein